MSNVPQLLTPDYVPSNEASDTEEHVLTLPQTSSAPSSSSCDSLNGGERAPCNADSPSGRKQANTSPHPHSISGHHSRIKTAARNVSPALDFCDKPLSTSTEAEAVSSSSTSMQAKRIHNTPECLSPKKVS